MKEKYSKPRLITETFRISQSVATHCGDAPVGTSANYGHTLADVGSCGYKLGVEGFVLFYNGSACSVDYNTPDENGNSIYEQYCYNNPVGSMTVFGS